jgi:hypothetical protein
VDGIHRGKEWRVSPSKISITQHLKVTVSKRINLFPIINCE